MVLFKIEESSKNSRERIDEIEIPKGNHNNLVCVRSVFLVPGSIFLINRESNC